MIPILYESNEIEFDHYGIGVLLESLSCVVTEERNGAFELELEYPIQGRWAKELIDQRLILAKPNDEDDNHLFRIYEVTKNLEESSIIVYASTITNDLGSNLVTIAEATDVNAQVALDTIKNNLVYPTDFNLVSDIQTVSSSRWENVNPLTCIAGMEGSILDRWGGEIKRTNDTIYVYGRRGTDNVAMLRPGKGLTGLRQTISTKGLITCILPYATYTENDETFIVKGDIVDSPQVSAYPIRYLQAIDFSQIGNVFPEPRGSEETPWTKAEYQAIIITNLNSAAANYFTSRNPECDEPKVTLEVDLMQLSDSSEYANFKSLEHISLTDTITVWVEKFNIDVTLKIMEIQYNSLIEQVVKIVAGNAKYNLYEDVTKTYEDSVNKLKEYIKTVENGIYNTIRITADGKNNIFSGYTEPDSSLSKLDDIWYKPVEDGEIEMYRYDGSAWQIAVGNASKLDIGEIDARKISLIYLNASNISTGTIVGANGAWNLNTGDFHLGSAGSGSSLHWDGTSLVIKMSAEQTLEEYMAEMVESFDVEYATSPSMTTPPTGTWYTTAPAWTPDLFIWTRTIIHYKNNTTTYKPSVEGVCISGINGVNGNDGYTPVKGTDYFDGTNGSDGVSSYIWVRYSDTSDGATFTTSPVGALYIGVATTYIQEAPTDNELYKWSLIKGTDGTNGVKGEDGADGISRYLHIKYSDNGTSFTANNGEDVGDWIGTLVDSTEADSMVFGAYTWNKVVGEPGYTPVKGSDYFDGVNGTNGVSSYLWVKYSMNADGTGFNDTPAGALYIGVATTTVATAPIAKTSYNWTLIKGTNGTDGVKGETGANGLTTYLHIKYSDNGTSFTASNGEVVGKYIGTMVDNTPTDSMTFGAYTWNLVKGKSISEIKEQYYLSTSGTTQVGGEWLASPPLYNKLKFMWTRNIITWIDPSDTTYTSPILSSEWEGLKNAFTAIADIDLSITNWTAKFGSIGGRNLLLNSNVTKTNSIYQMAIYDMTERMVVGQDYIITIWGSLGAGKSVFGAYINSGSKSVGNLAAVVDQPGVYRVAFKGIDGGETNPLLPDRIVIYAIPNTVVVNSTINRIQLETGLLPTAWTPSPDEMYVGSTRVDQFGIDVSNNVDDTHTSITPTGVRILEVGTNSPILIADKGEGVVADSVRAGMIFGGNIVNSTGGNRTLYVSSTATGDGSGKDASNKASSINTALTVGLGENVKFLSNRCLVTINLAGTINEDVYIGGYMGSGTLVIDGGGTGILKGDVYIENTTLEVQFINLKHYNTNTESDDSGTPTTERRSMYTADNSTNVYIKNCILVGNGFGRCFFAWRNGGIHSQQNDIVDFQRTYVAWTNSIVSNDRDKGSRAGQLQIAYAGYGGRVILAETRPLSGSPGTISGTASGGWIDVNDATGAASTFAPATAQTPITTYSDYSKIFYMSRKRENRSENNWYTDGEFGQGKGSNGNIYRGHGYLYGAVASWLAGSGGYQAGTVSMRMRAMRGSVWGQDTPAVALKFTQPNTITTNAVARNTLTNWVNLSPGAVSSILSGNDHFYTETTSSGDYARFDWIQLEVSAKKR